MTIKFKWETEFKETEIGEIPKDWEVKRMEEMVTSMIKGKPPIKKYKDKGNFPYLSAKYLRGEEEPSEFYSEDAGYIINDEDIIILWDGSKAGEIFKGKSGILASTMCKLVLKKDVNERYIYIILKSREEDIQDSKHGTDDRHVDKEFFLTLELPYPPPHEQQKISTILSWFDDHIENKKKQNEILEKTAMAIFKSWFVDFEPFKDEEFVDSELGRVPKGWEVKPIGEIAELRRGLSYSGKEKFNEPVEGGYVFITLNNAIEGGGFKPVYAWIKSERIRGHHFVSEGDLIIPNTEQTKDERLIGSPGIVFFPFNYTLDRGVYSHHITKFFLFDEKLKYFLYLFLKLTREDSGSFATGTNILGMDIENFKRNKLLLIPPQPILQKFHSLVEPLFNKIILNQKEIMVLRHVRDTLLPLLVFGKLRVEEV